MLVLVDVTTRRHRCVGVVVVVGGGGVIGTQLLHDLLLSLL